MTIPILEDYAFPIPICNDKALIKFPFASWDDFKKNLGNKTGDYVWDATKKFLGLEDVIDGSRCNTSIGPSVNKERKFTF